MALAETARQRRQLVEDAGWGTTSWISVLAGTLVAFGAITLVACAAGAAGSALGLDTDGISTREWRQAGITATVIGALVVLGAFFIGGYTAGRMGRRAGARHGLLVLLMSLVIIGAIALIGWGLSDQVDSMRDSLRDNGVPTGRGTWGDIGIGAAIAAGAAMLVGSIAGGIRGDRWHGRLATAVVEQRETMRDEVVDRDRVDEDDADDSTVDGTRSIDLRDDRELSVEEQREQQRLTAF